MRLFTPEGRRCLAWSFLFPFHSLPPLCLTSPPDLLFSVSWSGGWEGWTIPWPHLSSHLSPLGCTLFRWFFLPGHLTALSLSRNLLPKIFGLLSLGPFGPLGFFRVGECGEQVCESLLFSWRSHLAGTLYPSRDLVKSSAVDQFI